MIFFKEESYRIIACCIYVYNQLGAGFLEAVYQEALAIRFQKENIPFEREKRLEIVFDGMPLKKWYKADFLCYNQIVVETKATSFLSMGDFKQLNNYLKAIGKPLGIVVNFGSSHLQYQRIINPQVLPPIQ